ncbi:MAG: prepilin-type N-terminal cleavage/methylation domain-containing protein [Planctomycetaceae bacterium]|jgi:prepilin-type N-terminal cleavage/methylation domain-containing protein|nr:prepilin-type N-terminal cleavage/methylation domain-containing protein [Planctomycetaceae bacterium]
MPNYSPNSNQDQPPRTSVLRQVVGFTLIELLVVMAIISLLSAALLIALTELQASSKKGRCQQQIKKIDQLITRRWDELLHKPLPIQLSPASSIPIPQQILLARRELLRLEMPERFDDFRTAPTVFSRRPPTTNTFNNRLNQVDLVEARKFHQGAECLYLILSLMQDRDSSALDFFFPSEIGDTDNDGMPEILDGFGQPIGFLRWAPGFSYRLGIHNPRHQSRYSDIQDINSVDSPDATDMGAADSRLLDDDPANDPFNLFPLIMSAGRNGEFGLNFGTDYTNVTQYNDPFSSTHGTPIDDTILDNISNHQIEVNP